VVGEKTFGEGSVQKVLDVPDGSALILSVAKYYTPKDKIIQDTGITPNVPVASGLDDVAAVTDDDSEVAPDEPQQQQTKPQQKEDDQLKKALDVLNRKNQKS
jgi:carboxyl-terminal processing protease